MNNPSDLSTAAQPRLEDQLDALAQVPHLLIASDYDGTLAPIVPNPDEAMPNREAMVALRMLAQQDETHVAVISGRALRELVEMSQLPDSVHLVGSHGSEFDIGFIKSLTKSQQKLRAAILDELNEIAKQTAGALIEEKPAAIAFHYRNCDHKTAERACRQIEEGLAGRDGVSTKRGKMVIELSVVGSNKGEALNRIRQRVGANAVVFLGDDVTDEDAFATLRGPDVGIKVGDGESLAAFRVKDTRDVARVLARLAEHRAEWLAGGTAVPIDHHSLLSDQRTFALISNQARVCWMCIPRLDSPALFGEIVGGPGAGFFDIRPADGATSLRQQYLGHTLVLETQFPGFTVTDFLDCSGGRTTQRSGRTDLVRIVRGTGRATLEFAPRLDFSRTPTLLERRDGGIEVIESPDPLVLHAPGIEWSIRRDGPHHTAVADVELGDDPLVITLRCGAGTLRPAAVDGVHRELSTKEYWQSWTSRLNIPDTAGDLVVRSALTLKGLVYGPKGSIAAAATTSLPETIGGVRNWDYRFCWPRDAAISATALVKLGTQSEAMHLLDWLRTVVEGTVSSDRLNPVYSVNGSELFAEGEIGTLSGYAGSRPVRIGNAASRQSQLDTFAPVVELVHQLAVRDAPLTPQHWRIVEAMVSAVAMRWREPDHGIWEIRTERRHHVHSKVMCWCTIDRAIKTAELLRDHANPEWSTLRDKIKADVLEHGWNESVGAFTASYEQDDMDAASLWVGLSGLLEPNDERFHRTVQAVERELRRGPAVYRYRYDDGLPGVEGAFHLCTVWLILSYLMMGRREDAHELFEGYLSLAGPTGLYSEEYGATTKRALGNHPQAYSHAGLIECAVALDEHGC